MAGYNRRLTLDAGARLGPYEITAPLGAGGMGQVYRARDARLGRDVALKVLASDLVHDPLLLARFEQEAKAAAALNHPNIVAVFDVGVGDQPYVVSELLEGRTLRQALTDGPLPHKTAIDVAIQVARGIGAAHDRGIVHRDLKPENIFLTRDGHAKILDFGLAKLMESATRASGWSDLTTEGPVTTRPGTLLGTVGYMSPEQVRGETTDERTDIFAFGAVFYEMLSGRRAFARVTAVETLNAILNEDPPELSTDLRPISPALDRIVRRCLEKSANQRFQSASDVAFAIEAMSDPSTRSGATVSVPFSRRSRRTRTTLAIAAALAVGLAIGAIATRQLAPSTNQVVAFQPRTFDRLPVTNARFMPDGQAIVYSAARRGYAPELFVVNPNAEAPQPLGVTDAHLLAVSSKGELALIADARHVAQRLYVGTLARMTIGSSPRPMLDRVRDADWSPDGNSLAIVRDLGDGRDRLEYPAGTTLHDANGYLSDVRVSPDGTRVAFFEHQWRFDDRGWVKIADRSGRVTSIEGEFFGLQGLTWAPNGSTVLFSGSSMGGGVMQPMAVSAAGGDRPRPVFGVPGRFVVFDAAQDGRLLASREDLSLAVRARVPGDEGERDLSWLDSGARGLSRDGQWLLLVDIGPSGGKNYGVVLRKTDGSRTVRLGEGDPQKLSPDGRLALAIIASPPQIVLYPVGTGEAIRLQPGPIQRYGSAEWFPDGKRLFVCGAEPQRSTRCYEQGIDGSAPKPVTGEGVRALLAPDGSTLLLLMPDDSFQVGTIGGASRPAAALQSEDRPIAWSSDSRSVFVQRGFEVPATIERVDVTSGQRTVARKIATDFPGALTSLAVSDWIDEGPWYAYNLTTLGSALFTVSGATLPR